MRGREILDVVVIGGGPAGSVLAWSLARRGMNVAVVERETFPREKVCGDFVDPSGLRILEAMQCRQILNASARLPITCTRIFVQTRIAYNGTIPFYQKEYDLPPYGYIVPRHELDAQLLDRARQVSAKVYLGCAATEIFRDGGLIRVSVRNGPRHFVLKARLVVGADGTESIVAKSFDLLRADRRYIAVSQRAYIEGLSMEQGEATFWFDEDLFPGYGWMFPMLGGRANIGVGVLSEACQRFGLSIPSLFRTFVDKLRYWHPGCARIELVGKPRGGVVKMYGGVGPNYFDGGLLVGDAGSFADPMTGEGITPGMESALIASWTVARCFEHGRFDREFLSRYERDFRRYFDPSMRYLELCAAMMRNRHFSEFWLRVSLRGFQEARTDPVFARVAGSFFGGLDLRPLAAMGMVWSKIVSYVNDEAAKSFFGFLNRGSGESMIGLAGDFAAWQRGCWHSIFDDPLWHGSWLADVAKKSARLQSTLWASKNPRVVGIIPIV